MCWLQKTGRGRLLQALRARPRHKLPCARHRALQKASRRKVGPAATVAMWNTRAEPLPSCNNVPYYVWNFALC